MVKVARGSTEKEESGLDALQRVAEGVASHSPERAGRDGPPGAPAPGGVLVGFADQSPARAAFAVAAKETAVRVPARVLARPPDDARLSEADQCIRAEDGLFIFPPVCPPPHI